jgi:seryl-tRNA synthetase
MSWDQATTSSGSTITVPDLAAEDPLAPIATALFQFMGVAGVYARTALCDEIIQRLGALINRYRDPAAETLRFPPVMSRAQLEKARYLKSFPNLLGCVCALHGSESAIRAAADLQESGGDWTTALSPADLVLSPAACYPLYPIVAARGALPAGGREFDVAADCFRHEPSPVIDRLQSFRMREFVRFGSAGEIELFRERWMDRAGELAAKLGLQFSIETASDPFFGPAGPLLAEIQRERALKYELRVSYHPTAVPTACMSINHHREYFANIWGIKSSAGTTAESSCVAFGMDRLTMALFAAHGLDLAAWPADVRRALAL